MPRVITIHDAARIICKTCKPGREYTLMEIAERNKTNSKAVMAAAEYLEDMGLAQIGTIYGGKAQLKTIRLSTTSPLMTPSKRG